MKNIPKKIMTIKTIMFTLWSFKHTKYNYKECPLIYPFGPFFSPFNATLFFKPPSITKKFSKKLVEKIVTFYYLIE
jgi:hypothetical protein